MNAGETQARATIVAALIVARVVEVWAIRSIASDLSAAAAR
jgi:hypothetical protein